MQDNERIFFFFLSYLLIDDFMVSCPRPHATMLSVKKFYQMFLLSSEQYDTSRTAAALLTCSKKLFWSEAVYIYSIGLSACQKEIYKCRPLVVFFSPNISNYRHQSKSLL